MLIGEVLASTARRLPDKLAIKQGAFTQTFGELDKAANRFANALLRDGFGKGHIIGIYSGNRSDYPTIFFGAARSGVVLAHLSARFSVDEVRRVIDDTDIEALFVHAERAATIDSVHGDLPNLKRVIVFGGTGPNGTETIDAFIAGAPDSEPGIEIGEADPASIQYSGGTTGFPKGILASHAARTIGSIRARREFGLRDDDVFCCSTPLFHIAGLFVWFQTGILNGNTCVLMARWDAEEFMRLVEEDGVTAAFLIPTQITSIISHPNFSAERLKGWRYGNFGGAPNPVAQLEKMIELLPHVTWVEQYGQTESGNLTVRPPEYCRTKAASAGRAFADVEMAIFGPDDRPLPPGEVGELVTRGVHPMIGYYNNAEETAKAFTGNGWLKTGDVGYIDEDGFLFLVDRSKDMIISGGENVYPSEIENVLYQHPAVHECAVVGVPDDYWGELPAAHVVLQPDVDVDEAELIDFCMQRLARHKRPRTIKFVDKLPKTAVGKIQKSEIRAQYWRDSGRAL